MRAVQFTRFDAPEVMAVVDLPATDPFRPRSVNSSTTSPRPA
ncbi:MAG TPA: hypothetical protein VIH01_06220 [Blastococcus sp.]